MQPRLLTPDDAAAFLKLQTQLDFEATWMSFEPSERRMTVADQRNRLARLRENQIILGTEYNDQLVGYFAVYGGANLRNAHRAGITVAVLESFHRRGVATDLMIAAESWCQEHGISRLEATVAAQNIPALDFYKSHGFQVEGRRTRSLFCNGDFHDELYLGRLICDGIPQGHWYSSLD
jgi:RimJ/RimL family protein N-acetyltransferase